MSWSRFFRRGRKDAELQNEIELYLVEEAAENEARGMTPEEARRQARIKLGNAQRVRESLWQQNTVAFAESAWRDLKYAARTLLRAPGFTATAILVMALGIGAATTVFSLAYGALIDPFPYKNVQTLATPKLCSSEVSHCYWDEYTPRQVLEIAQRTSIFSGLTASTVGNVTVSGDGEPQQARGSYTTPNLFGVLGVQPILGRASGQDDVRAGRGEVALISYRFWQAHFDGDHSALGRVIVVDRHPRTVIGVMPPGFLWRGADVYLPIEMTPTEAIEGRHLFTVVGRVKPGVTEAQAAGELQSIFQDFAENYPYRYPKKLRLGLMTLADMFQSGLKDTLYLLLGAVLVLLLIACVNVSSLLLARAVKREHEFVLRSAVGASRVRLIRQALTESLLLVVVALPVALAFACLGLDAALRIVPKNTIPDGAVVSLNVPVLLVSIAMAVLAVVLFGLVPAWHNAHPRLAAALNKIRSSGSRTQRGLMHSFVVLEIALSLALLTLTGLMTRSLIAIEGTPVSFSPDSTLLMRVPLDAKRYPKAEDRAQFFSELLEQVSHLPGVKAATVDTELPFLWGYGAHIQIGSSPVRRDDYSNLHLVDPAYLNIARERMLEGHFINAREIAEQAHEAVVTENFAKRYFPDGNALGQTMHLTDFAPFDGKKLANDAFTVVGVMSNLPMYPGNQRDYPHIFLPYTVAPVMDTVVISTHLPPDELVSSVRRVVFSIDREQPVIDAMSLRELLNLYGYARQRFALTLFGTFAAAGLLLSFIGIYGVLSFVTAQRTQEVGIRMALGANRTSVMGMVLREAFGLALLGIAAGLPLALLAGRLARNELFHTSRYDPMTFFVVICIVPLLALAGTWIPARRAASIDPMQALRAE